MLETVISIAALIIAVVTFFLSRRGKRRLDQLSSYISIERDSDNHICLLLIQHDFLNKLFYEQPSQPPPNSETLEEDFTVEQRAIENFGSLYLDYLEQMLILHLNGVLPRGIWATWEKWLEESSRAPYFLWVWQLERDSYHSELAVLVDKYITIALGLADYGSSQQHTT